MIIALFEMHDKDKKFCFFEKTSLLADISIGVAFEMFFLTLNNVKFNFNNEKLKWRFYIAAKVFPITKHVELVEKKEFITIVFSLEDKIFVVPVVFFAIFNEIYLYYKA